MTLSKSLYMRGLQCPKFLWLKKYKKDILSVPDSSAEVVFATGNRVGELACELFTPGEKIEFTPDKYQQMFEKTQQLLNDGVKNIYKKMMQVDIQLSLEVENRCKKICYNSFILREVKND